jgi:hypothetical protein
MIKCKGLWTVEQIKAAIVETGSTMAAARKLKVNGKTLASFMRDHGGDYKRPERGKHSLKPTLHEEIEKFKPLAAGEVGSPDMKRETLKGNRFVFTSAQNNTYVNEDFWRSLRHFCKDKGAKLYVSRFAYNKKGFQNPTKGEDGLWYDGHIEPYILDRSVVVAQGLIFCGELDILPTAVDPLSGFDSYCGGASGIYPHTKVALKSLPRVKGLDPRFLYTTGTVTQRNYIQRKAGQKAEFHHVYGALYVEVDNNGIWFARQLIADSAGVFHDLTKRYTPDGVEAGRVEAITYGDIHIEKIDEQVAAASWESKDSMLNVLKPKYQFVHDLTDFSARNHHEIGNPYFIAKKYFDKEDSVSYGLISSACFLDEISEKSKVIVVESNHHEAFERWLRSADGHRDPENAEFWHRCNAEIFKAMRLKDKDFDIYEFALRNYRRLDNVKFLRMDESFTIGGVGKAKGYIECGIHGHRGINGARGQSSAYRSIGCRVNVGHSHSAGIVDGVYTAGVSGKLDMDYNKGPSSWSHSHIVTYANGKRAIITIKSGKWRA